MELARTQNWPSTPLFCSLLDQPDFARLIGIRSEAQIFHTLAASQKLWLLESEGRPDSTGTRCPQVAKRWTVNAEKDYIYTDKRVREFIFRNMTDFFADLSLIRTNLWNVIFCLKHDPTELYLWLSGELAFRKTRNNIT